MRLRRESCLPGSLYENVQRRACLVATAGDTLNMPRLHPSRRALLFSVGAAAFKAFAKIGRIELGVCGNPDTFAQAEQWGFDYFEPGAASIAAMSEPEFMAFRGHVLASRLRCRSFN